MEYYIRNLQGSKDIAIIKQLLLANHLPTDDIDDHIDQFLLIEAKDNLRQILAFGCVEPCVEIDELDITAQLKDASTEKVGLLRSVVVDKDRQGQGLGQAIIEAIEHDAKQRGFTQLYLLTESAESFFSHLGYTPQDRAQVATEVKNTKQFNGLCPASAVVMMKTLS